LGQKPFFLIGNSGKENPQFKDLIHKHEIFVVSHEPTISLVEEAILKVRKIEADVIISIGGGSVLDAGKAVAALTPNPGSVLDYLEVIGGGKQLENDPLPFIAVPTTAGTGTEVTKNAVILSPEHRVKVSLRDKRMYPTVALVDPELTYSLPPAITAYSGIDAFTQCLEPYVSHLSTPITDPICMEGIRLVARSLLVAYQDGQSVRAREEMALASTFGGLALANAKLGAVHGFAGPIGGMFSAPHGAVCAALLKPVVEINIKELTERDPENPSLEKYDQIGKIVSGNASAGSAELVTWLSELLKELDIPGLAGFGIKSSDFSEIIEKSIVSSSIKGNPITLSREELREILERAL
jgi:alcohol dehydrogenase class IV